MLNVGDKYYKVSINVGKVLELAEKAKLLIGEDKRFLTVPVFSVENGGVDKLSYQGDGVYLFTAFKKDSVVTEENIIQ